MQISQSLWIFHPSLSRHRSEYPGFISPIPLQLSHSLSEEGNSIEIAEQARKEGFNDLRTSGLLKAMQGITSLEEVNRVTKD
ncbi:TPA: hypothetical protein L3591_002251 [Pseudomonas aeruginosa]|nr:hypothetical protein [Pseudomonas aeruginosa]